MEANRPPDHDALLREVRGMRESFDMLSGAVVYLCSRFAQLEPAHIWDTADALVARAKALRSEKTGDAR